ncbi:MAG TPA: CopG family transcriptional regulator [Candidatus Latescibacteria bacterium]|nr:CopG family transcriptional regulator [Candidatus Latescibacterota bacterium]
MVRTKSVEVPEALYRAIEGKLQGSSFLSVSEFVTYAARKFLSELNPGGESLSEEEKEDIIQRLKVLGYI